MATGQIGAGTATTGQPDNYGLGQKTPDYITLGNGSTSGTSSGTNTSAGSSTSTGVSTQTTNSSSKTQTLDDQTMALLRQMVAQLAGGGTPQMKQQQAERNAEIATLQNNRAGYTKDAAFADSQGLIAQQTRRVMESLLPNINRAAEDAGSSGGALRALLLQDAGNKAAESASALGVNAAASYGSTFNNSSSILEALTRVDPSSVNALAQIVNALKGGVTNTTGTSTTVGTQDTSGTTNNSTATTGKTNGTTTDNKMVDFAPFQPLTLSTFNNGNQNPQISYGGNTDSQLSNDLLSQLATNRAFSDFQF